MGTNKDIEMTTKPSADVDKAISPNESAAEEERPPTPPRRRDFTTKDNLTTEDYDKRRKTTSLFQRPEVIYKPENPESSMGCLKMFLILFNLLIWLFGAAMTGIGIWLKVDHDFWEIQTGLDMKQFVAASTILIVAGVVIMIVGFLGCYGACMESLCMLVTYAIIVVIIILLEIAVIALVFTAINNKEVKDDIKGKAKKAMQEMSKNERQLYFLNLLQTKLKCCGIDGPADYDENGIPHSCTNPDTGYPYTNGCLETVVQYFKSKAGMVGGVTAAIFLLQLAALGLTICVACGIRQAASNAIF